MIYLWNFWEFGGSSVSSASATSLLRKKNCLQMLSKRRTMGGIPWVCENPPVVLRSALGGGCLGELSWLYQALTLIIVFLFELDCVDTQYLKCFSELIISVKLYSAKNWVSFSVFTKSKALVLVVCQNMTEWHSTCWHLVPLALSISSASWCQFCVMSWSK